jgi:hypothetical protein
MLAGVLWLGRMLPELKRTAAAMTPDWRIHEIPDSETGGAPLY